MCSTETRGKDVEPPVRFGLEVDKESCKSVKTHVPVKFLSPRGRRRSGEVGVVTLAEHVPGKLRSLDVIEIIEAKKLAGFLQHLFDHGRLATAERRWKRFAVDILKPLDARHFHPRQSGLAKDKKKKNGQMVSVNKFLQACCEGDGVVLPKRIVGLESRLDSRSR